MYFSSSRLPTSALSTIEALFKNFIFLLMLFNGQATSNCSPVIIPSSVLFKDELSSIEEPCVS